MIGRIKEIYIKYSQLINYLIVGAMTTGVSLGTKYALLFTILDAKNPFELQVSVIVSWIVAVLFAYVTNRKFVFNSKDENIIHEMTLFILSRVTTLVMEAVILWFFITYLKMNSNFYVVLWTIVSQIMILIGNYILSKFFVFNRNKDKTNKSINKEFIYNIAMFCMLTIIGYMFPYTHDDWAWGSSIGIERLNCFFYNYNGRWAGNLLVLLLTRFRILRAIVVSSTMTLIVHMIQKNVSCKNKYSKYIGIVLMLLMPVNIIAQSIAWTAGFANYVIPILIVLVVMYLNKNIFREQDSQISNKWMVPLLFAGFVCSLFVEHMTIYNICFSVFIVGYYLIKNKKMIWSNVLYALGSIAGAIVMFSNGAYHQIVNAEDTYRTIEKSNIFIKMMKTYFDTFYELFIQNNIVLNIFICIICFIAIYKYIKNKEKTINKKIKVILYGLTSIFIIFISYNVFIKVVGNNELFVIQKYNNYLQGIMILLYCISVLITMFICIDNKKRRYRLIFELISTVIISAPLLIVTPIGPRCFLPTYVFLTLFAIDAFDYLFEKTELDISCILKISSIIIMMFFLIIYGQVYFIECERINYIEEHNEDSEIILPNLPFENYMQVPNPLIETFNTRFKLFYNINENSIVRFIPYNEWKK